MIIKVRTLCAWRQYKLPLEDRSGTVFSQSADSLLKLDMLFNVSSPHMVKLIWKMPQRGPADGT
jgi:hypothetical protein